MGSLRSFRKPQVEPITIPKPSDAEFIAAVHVGSVKKVTDLLQRGANPNAVDKNFASESALGVAVSKGNIGLVRLLVAQGANVNQRNSGGGTPLAEAVFAPLQTRLTIGLILLDHGANVDATDYFGDTPLIRARWFKDDDMARLLIERGADANRRNIEGEKDLEIVKNKIDQTKLRNLLAQGSKGLRKASR